MSTYPDREHVEYDDENQKDRDPDGIVDSLAHRPVQGGLSILVAELDCVRDSNQLLAGEDGVGKPYFIEISKSQHWDR